MKWRYTFVLVFALSVIREGRACFILFLADGHRVIVGNHEDWFATDAAVRINTPANGKYGSVIFTFQHEGWAQGGMNEKGLFFDGAYTPFQEVTFDSHVGKYPGYIWQTVLDKTATVKEALELISHYELPELRESHILLADATGDAVIVGVNKGKVVIKRFEQHYLMQTNFNPWNPELSDEPVCWRFKKAEQLLGVTPDATVENMKNILEKTHQDSLTVYSNIYDLQNKVVYTYNKRNFNKAIAVSLPDFFRYGNCTYPLDSLEGDKLYWAKCQTETSSSIKISGKVIDSKTGLPVPYANIGLFEKNIGTLSDPDGSFEITIPHQFAGDSIMFSSIGFDRIIRSVSAFKRPSATIALTPNSTLLEEVVVRGEKLRNNNRARLGWMGGKDGALPFDTLQGGGTIALLVESPKAPSYVDKLQLRLMYNSKDTLKFRLHLFAYDSINHIPGEELLSKEIILKENKRFGWLRFDLSEYGIELTEEKFFVAFEWIDDRKTREAMLKGLLDWEHWKKDQFESGNQKVELVKENTGPADPKSYYKYHGNMMDWPGFTKLPPFTGVMVETGKNSKTIALKTFERKTSFGKWTEIQSTLNAVITVAY